MVSTVHRAITRVRLFGPGVIERDGCELETRTRKERWLLARLLLQRDRPIGRGQLADQLWPRSDQARANLRRSLWNLTTVLGASCFRLETSGTDLVTLHAEGMEVDLLTFDALIRNGSTASLAQAIDLYRSPLLEGCLEDWILPEREAREQSCLQALRQLADDARDANDLATANHYLRRALAVDPLHEESVRALMQTLADQGELASANQVYRKLRQRLSEQLLPDPDPTTQALFESLKARNRQHSSARIAHSAPRPARAPNRIPQPEHRLIGRETAVWEVSGLLAQARLVTLVGIGGIGKTRLAIAVASECAADYTDGSCFVDLSALSDPRRVVQAVASARGLPERKGEELLQTLQADLAQRSLLLILDNCEHLRVACAALCAALLAHCPNLHILATSRERLGLPEEIESVWRVPALALPPQRATVGGEETGNEAKTILSRALACGAIRLFVERARQAKPGFSLGPADVEAIVQICRRLDGNALAIELAASRVSTLSADEIAARLDDRFQLLQGGKRSLPRRQQALRASMDWSYDLLDKAEKALLRRLSVFAGGWTLAAAEAVCGDFGFWILDFGLSSASPDGAASDSERKLQNESSVRQHTGHDASAVQNPKSKIQNQEVFDLLTSLVGKSLVVVEDAEGGERRYRLLETVREYARRKLEAAGEAVEIGRRHRDYFLGLAEEQNSRGPKQMGWMERMEREHDNVRAALDYCLNSKGRGKREEGRVDAGSLFPDPSSLFPECLVPLPSSLSSEEAGLRLGAGMYSFWEARGYFTEGRERLTALLAQAETRPPTIAYAKALNSAGTLAVWQSDYNVARSQLESSLALARNLKDQAVVASALAGLGTIAHWQGDYEAARAFFEESLANAQAGGTGISADTLSKLGEMAREQGDYERARALQEESLARARNLGDLDSVCVALANLGNIAHNQGEYRAARALYEEGLALARDLGNRWIIALYLGNLGTMAQMDGDMAEAFAAFEECLGLLEELGDKRNGATALIALVSLCCKTGNYMQARVRLTECMGILRQTGDRYFTATASMACASLARAQGCIEWAARLHGGAEALRSAIGAPLTPDEEAEYRREIEDLGAALGTEMLAQIWSEGQALTPDQVIELSLDFLTGSSPL